jgi:hypothetical protein
MSDLGTWLDVFTIIGVLVVSGWLMRGITFLIEYRRRKYLEPMLNEIDRLSTVGANNDKSEQISRKIFGDLTGLAMSVVNDDRV